MERGDFPGTPTKGASFAGDPTMNYPYYLTPRTSAEIILNHPSASADTTDSCARDTMTSCDPPCQSLSPPTPAAGAGLHNVLSPPTQNHTLAGLILCLLAQQNTSSFTGKIDAASVFHADTDGIGEKTNKRRRDGSKRAIQREISVGDRFPLQSNISVRPKELTRDETRRMLMDKARTEINRYFGA